MSIINNDVHNPDVKTIYCELNGNSLFCVRVNRWQFQVTSELANGISNEYILSLDETEKWLNEIYDTDAIYEAKTSRCVV